MSGKVFIGVGHGGTDGGAIGIGGVKEKAINLSIAKACGAELERHGVQVLLSRTKDEDDTVQQEIAECNKYAPDLAVDVHNNAGGGDGVETFYTKLGGTGKKLAENILAQIVALGQQSRGAKTRTNSCGSDFYAFIRETKAPAVIVECAFIDSSDVELVDTEKERAAVGVAIARGILQTLGVVYKPVSSPTEGASLYRVQTGAYSRKEGAEAHAARLRAAGFEAIVKKS